MKFKYITAQNKAALLLSFLLIACSEQPIISSRGEYRLNSPSSMFIIPGESLAIVTNGNVNLDQTSGALMAVDLSTNELLTDTKLDIPNFAGDMFVDVARKKIYIPDHDQSMLVYKYQIPGEGGRAISFSALNVPEPTNNDRAYVPNGVQTDEGPAQALMVSGTSQGDLILVTTQQGSVSMIKASTLKYIDKNPDTKYYGLPLFSASTFQNATSFPGRGANRMAISPATGLVYITSPVNNQIYVLDPDDQTIEAMIDLDSISLPTVGMRDIKIDSNEIAYIAHSGLDSIIVMDLTSVIRNQIPYEVIAPPVLAVIPVGDGPEDLALNAAGTNLFVSNQNEDSVYLIDTALRQIVKRTYLNKGKSPSRLVLDEPNNVLYSLDFYSNSISRYNATTGTLIGAIQ